MTLLHADPTVPAALHVSDAELLQLACGELHYSLREWIEPHVAECRECGQRLRALQGLFAGEDASDATRLLCAPAGDEIIEVAALKALDHASEAEMTLPALSERFRGLEIGLEQHRFVESLMTPNRRRWFRACHAHVHAGAEEGCASELLTALGQLPEAQSRMALLHYELARALRASGRSFEAALPAIESLASTANPRGFLLDLAHELLTEPDRLDEIIRNAELAAVWHGDLRPAERSEKILGVLVEIHRDPTQDQPILISLVLEVVICKEDERGSLCVFPAPAFALWDRDDDFRAAQAAAAQAAAAQAAAAQAAAKAVEPAGSLSASKALIVEVRWRLESTAERPWPGKISGPSLGLPFAFLLRRLLAKPHELIARLSLDGVVLTGAIATSGQILPVGEIVRKIPEGVHTVVAPRQQIEHPGVTRLDPELRGVPDTKDILSARGGAVHILRVGDVEEAAEMLAVDHETRWQGIDFELPSLPEDYVGRETLEDEVLRFVERTSSGYGVVVGRIGAGKTTFMKRLLHRLAEAGYGPTFHLIPTQPGGAGRGENVARNLYCRLRRKHGTAEPEAWSGWDISRKLEELLKFLSEKNGGRWKEVIVVDAANQAELPSHKKLVPDILPGELPPGVICLLSSRTDLEHWLGDRNAVSAFFEMHDGTGNREASTDDRTDIRRFLLQQRVFALDPLFIEAIVKQPHPPIFFTVVKRLEELRDPKLRPQRRAQLLSEPDLWVKPPEELIVRKIDSIRNTVDPHQDIAEMVWETLGVMALVREPVTERQLRGLGLWRTGVTDKILREAASFFCPRVEPCPEEEPFRFDHPGFPQVIGEMLKIDGRERCQRILAECCRNWGKLRGPARLYAVQHGPAHLRRARMWDELYEALTDFAYLEERMIPARSASAGDCATTLPEDLPQRLVMRVLRHLELALHGQPAFPADDPRREAIAALHRAIEARGDVFQHAPELLAQELHNELAWEWDERTDLGRKLRRAVESSPRIVLPRLNRPVVSSERIRRQVFKGHRKTVNCVALSPDETIVASASDDATVILWRALTGEVLRILRGHATPVRSVTWNSDGSTLASAGRKVRLWNRDTGVCSGELSVHGGAALVAFSPKDELLAVAGNDGSVRLFHPASEAVLAVLRAPGPRICCMAFSPDGRVLAIGGTDSTGWRGAVELYDVHARVHLRTLPKLDYWIGAVAFSSDGKTVATGGGVKIGEVRLFDVGSGGFQRALEVHRSGVRALALSEQGTLVTCSYDYTMGLRELATGTVLRTGLHHSEVLSVAISRAGNVLISAGVDHTVIVWHLGQAPAVAVAASRHEAHEDTIWATRFSPDGRHASTASKDGTARIFADEASQPCRVFAARGEAANIAVISPCERMLAIGSRGIVRIVDAQSGAELHCLQGHGSWVLDLAWTPDGTRLVSVSEDQTAMVWDLRTGRWHCTLKAHTARLRATAISPDGKYAVTAGEDARIHVWDVETGQLLRTLHGHNQHIKALACSHDGLLASAGSDDFIKLWELGTGRDCGTLRVPAREIWALAFAPERYLAAGGRDGMARLFDLGMQTQAACLPCRDAIHALWFSPDGMEFRVVDRGGADLIPNIYVTRIIAPA